MGRVSAGDLRRGRGVEAVAEDASVEEPHGHKAHVSAVSQRGAPGALHLDDVRVVQPLQHLRLRNDTWLQNENQREA